jgi:hypothetical protein
MIFEHDLKARLPGSAKRARHILDELCDGLTLGRAHDVTAYPDLDDIDCCSPIGIRQRSRSRGIEQRDGGAMIPRHCDRQIDQRFYLWLRRDAGLMDRHELLAASDQ